MWLVISRIILRYRLTILLIVFASTVFILYQSTSVRLSYQMAKILPRTSKIYVDYEKFRNEFGDNRNTIVIGVTIPRLFNILEYIKKNNITYSHTDINIGLCSSLNTIFKKASYNYFLYAHDDMYFCPEWDMHLTNELKKIKHDKFYLSGTMIEPNSGHIKFNCGDTYNTFNEQKLISNFKKINFYDHQGSHFAPHLVSKNMWNKVGGLSEEFYPGIASDPDFNMKLWKEGVRIFKGINNFKVYHFGSISLRKKNDLKGNKGSNTFLKKWGFAPTFFVKHYLRGGKFSNNKCSPG